MKYDFDAVVDRAHDPYSYSMKWRTDSSIGKLMAGMLGYDELPEDRLCFQTADMDFKCAPEITEALIKTAEHGIFGYSAPPAAYNEAVCHWFSTRFGWNFAPESVFLGAAGTHEVIATCIKSYTEPGDGIIVLLPSYNYHMDIEPIGRVMAGVQMINDHGYYTVDYEALEKACAVPENKMIILIQPHNPTGRVFTEEEILKIGEICRRHDVIILSDEVHIDIARKGMKVLPVMKVLGPKGVISATAVNKTFNVAGLAMSNLIVEDPQLIEKLDKGFPIATPFGISAVIAAYTKCAPWVDELNEYLDRLIDYAMERFAKDLPKVTITRPEGTYVLWADFSGYGLSDDELDERLKATHIIIGDGVMFDAENGRQFRRFCLTSPMSQVKEAFDRLARVF